MQKSEQDICSSTFTHALSTNVPTRKHSVISFKPKVELLKNDKIS